MTNLALRTFYGSIPAPAIGVVDVGLVSKIGPLSYEGGSVNFSAGMQRAEIRDYGGVGLIVSGIIGAAEVNETVGATVNFAAIDRLPVNGSASAQVNSSARGDASVQDKAGGKQTNAAREIAEIVENFGQSVVVGSVQESGTSRYSKVEKGWPSTPWPNKPWGEWDIGLGWAGHVITGTI